jgi:hypothetical protein
MAGIPKDVKRMLFGGSAKQQSWLMVAFTWVCWACLIVGIVGDAIDKTLGLEPTSWFLISIGFLIAAVWHWFRTYYAAKEG